MMRTKKHYESMFAKNPGSTIGISLAAQAVYAAVRGDYPGPNESQGTDMELYRSIYRRLQARYGEVMDADEVRREMAVSAAQGVLGSIMTKKKAASSRVNGARGGRPRSRKAPRCHRDGTVSYWSVYRQSYVTRSAWISDEDLAAMNADDRQRVREHLAE